MRIIHTSDWHLGKNLDGTKNNRLEEQEKFIDEFVNIVEHNKVDMIIISGDIYDNGNPSAKAERLFYDSLKRLSDNGKRPIIIIAGNHDNPERLVAASPLAYEQGIIMLGTPKAVVEKGRYGSCEVLDSGEGYLEIELRGEKAVIIAIAYPSEKRLNEIFIDEDDEHTRQSTYSDKIGKLFDELSLKYREDTINIAVSHIFVRGGAISDSERNIELGGSLAVDAEKLPKKAQYVALGHLHKPQKVKGTDNAYYSGSPIQYSKSEIGYAKCVFQVDLKQGEPAKIEKILLSNYKPIEVWKCENIDEAIEMCKENKDRHVWVYLEIKTEEYISQEYIKEMNELKKDIVEIIPVIQSKEEDVRIETLKEKSMKELFREFYFAQRGVEIDDELMDMFLAIVNDEDNHDF